MKARLGIYLLLPVLLSTLLVVLACGGTKDPVTMTPPAETTPRSERPLSDAERKTVEEFDMQKQEIEEAWETIRTDFDQWRTGLTSCQRSAVREVLQEFALQSSSVTISARDLTRTSVTSELADQLIIAAESEELAFRQLRDRWSPNNLSLFEAIEEERSKVANVQRRVEDQARELEEDLREASDPETINEVKEFAAVLHSVAHDWEAFHDGYARLLRAAIALEDAEVIARLEQLFMMVSGVGERVDSIVSTGAIEDRLEELQDTARAEHKAFVDVFEKVIRKSEETLTNGEDSDKPDEEEASEDEETSQDEEASQTTRMILASLEPAIEKSRTILKEANDDVDEVLEGKMEEDLEDLRGFVNEFERLKTKWEAFHRSYGNWRGSDGGCDRAQVYQSLDQFNIRAGEIVRKARGLSQAGYLLPVYELVVEAAEREEGSIRTLRNSWQPFTVDAFIAVERERDIADRLRLQAGIALEELRSR